MTPKLLIVEDDPEIVSALQRGLALHGYDTDAENRADLALERLKSETFSGAIIDVMLGEDSGINLVRHARHAGVTVPILMLSALSDVENRTDGLEAGADDYVVKPFTFDELVARLRVQERRAETRYPEPARLSSEDQRLSNSSGTISLTDREFALLHLLVARAGELIARGEIFDALWASETVGREHGSENVVDVYIGYLRKKLNGQAFGFEIKTIRNRGFCIEGLAPITT